MTTVTPPTMILVDGGGEFTRRVVKSPEAARSFARAHALPVYDVTIVGYPARMRRALDRERAERRRDRQREWSD